jgi:transposase
MDNLRQHSWQPTKDVIAQAGHTQVFRPKYAPEFGPIKLVISNIKMHLRRYRHLLTQDLIPSCLSAIVQEIGPFHGAWAQCGL